MTALRVPIALLALLLLAACGDDEAPAPSAATATATRPAPAAVASPTPAPPAPTESPAPTVTPSQEPTAAPTEAAPSPTLPPASPVSPTPASTSGPPVVLEVSAMDLSFDRAMIAVPANTQVTVNFTNNDVAVPHDFGVSIPFVPHSATCNGPCMASITFNSGPAGEYTFQCSIHAEMVGSFVVN